MIAKIVPLVPFAKPASVWLSEFTRVILVLRVTGEMTKGEPTYLYVALLPAASPITAVGFHGPTFVSFQLGWYLPMKNPTVD